MANTEDHNADNRSADNPNADNRNREDANAKDANTEGSAGRYRHIGTITNFHDTFKNKDNPPTQYERFYHAKRYVKSKSEQHTSKEARFRIGRALGYNLEKPNFLEKLGRRRRVYDALDTTIPLAYFQAIGVDMNELDTCVEADQELFEREKRKPRYPRQAVVRYMAAVYGIFRFPEGTEEPEALRMLNESNVARFQRCIVYPELLTIWVDRGPDAEPHYDYYEPRYELKKHLIRIRKLPKGTGQTLVG